MRHTFATRKAARLALFDYIEAWYNPHRERSVLGYLSPAAYEGRWFSQSGVA
jgi:transposase InsO family protein